MRVFSLPGSSLDVLTSKVFYPPLLDAGLGPDFSLCLLPEGIKSDHMDGASEAPLGLVSHMTAAQWCCAAQWEMCLGDTFPCYYRDSDGVKATMQGLL